MPIGGIGAFVRQAKNDRAWLVENAQGQDVTEVEVEGHDNLAVGLCSLDKSVVSAPLEADGRFQARSQRRPRTASSLGPQRVQFILGERSRVRERLADILLVKVWKVLHNLCGRHAVGDEVDDVGHGNAKPADRRAPTVAVAVPRVPQPETHLSLSGLVQPLTGDRRLADPSLGFVKPAAGY